MKTIRFEATIGIIEGYAQNEDVTHEAAMHKVAEIWQKAAKSIYKSSGIYISAVVQPSKTVYHEEWGCPLGGESTATVHGEANPKFIDDTELWKQSVIEVIRLVKSWLKQSTVAVSFMQVDDYIYFSEKS